MASPMLSTLGLPIKINEVPSPYVVLEIQYRWNAWFKKCGVNADLI